MPALSGDPVPLWRGVRDGWSTHGWGDAPSSCLSIPPAAQPIHSVPSSSRPPSSPRPHPHVLTPAVPYHHGSCHRPWVPHSLAARAVSPCMGLLSAPRCSCDPGAFYTSPVPSHPPQPARGPRIPFPIAAHGFLPLCAPYHLQVPASSRLTTLNCPSLRSSVAHHDPPLLLFFHHPSCPIHFVPAL